MASSNASSNVQAAQPAMPTTSPPVGFSLGRLASMFTNAQNTHITSSSFTITNNSVQAPLDALHRRVSPNAILNAGGRADEVRCHPGTREEVIDCIEKWRDNQDDPTPPIFWLSGPAGAGKTAIVQTIAERCNEQHVPQANFFFFRTDSSRNTLSSMVATLVHQIVLLYPALRDRVAAVLAADPLVFDAILEDQLTRLIITPLQAIRQSSPSCRPLLLLIDGLDECDSEEKRSQQQILHAFDKVCAELTCPFRLLVASRDEPQIQAAFNRVSSLLLPLYLDDQYSPRKDIEIFVTDKFEQLRKTHPLAYTLDTNWPSSEDVENIVRKSSGQFMYAATVMRFISDSVVSPALSLSSVQNAAPASTKSPFPQLDAIYTYILSRVDDQETLKLILHAQLFIDPYFTLLFHVKLVDLLAAYSPKYTEAMVASCLATLTPIAKYHTEGSTLLFHHASIYDYLCNQSRSSDYFVDLDAFNFKIQPTVWKMVSQSQYKKFTLISSSMEEFACTTLMQLHRLPPNLLNIIGTMKPWGFRTVSTGKITHVEIFKHLANLCASDDDLIHYKRILRPWIKTQLYRPDGGWPPHSDRYLTMAMIERDIVRSSEMVKDDWRWYTDDLCPTTKFDVQEMASWVDDLLHGIYRDKYIDNIQEYNFVLQVWVSWAYLNDIPLDGVMDLPNARWYFQQSRIEKWGAFRFDSMLDSMRFW